MSIQNILVDNDLDLFCENLTVKGNFSVANVSITENLTIESTALLDFVSGSEIGGVANFNNTSIVNFSNGSLIEGRATMGNGGDMTFNNNTTLTLDPNATLEDFGINNFNDGSEVNFHLGCDIVFPSATYVVTPLWFDNTSSFPVLPNPTISISFLKIGQLVIMSVPRFYYVGVGDAGIFTIPFTGIDARYLPTSKQIISCAVQNDGVMANGYFYCNFVSTRFELRGPQGFDVFTGTNLTNQGLVPSGISGADNDAKTIVSYLT